MSVRSLGAAGRAAAAACLLLAFVALPEALLAQNANLGAQQLGRPYWHVFAAYAIGWVLIFGWVVSIARRLRSLERKIDSE